MSPWSRNGWPLFRNGVLLIAVIASTVWSAIELRKLAAQDPFASLRPREVPGLGEQVGAQLRDVQFRHYQNGKLSTSAQIGKIDVLRDRSTYQLHGIKNGKVPNGKDPIQFAAAEANWRNDTKQLNVTDRARLANKDFDVTTPVLTLDQQRKLLNLPKPISGRISSGIGRADRMQINLDNQAVRASGTRWMGALPAVVRQDAPVAANDRTAWDVRSDEWEDSGAKTKTMTHKNATATDGEVLIKAPTIVIDRKTDVLTATGRVFYYSAKANLVADKIVIYRKEKRAVLTGSVVMLVKPKDEPVDYKPQEEELPPFRPLVPDDVKATRPAATNGPSEEEKELDEKLRDGETLRQYPLTMLSKEVTYWYAKGKRRALIEGSPQARQTLPGDRWRQFWTHRAEYDGEQELLKTFSRDKAFDCRMKNSIGDDLVALTFTIHTAEGDERFSGQRMKGRVYTDPDEDLRDKDKDKKSDPPKKVDPPTKVDPRAGTGTSTEVKKVGG
ncbi:MAG: hypothetical protein SFX74_07875 [Fimbriimonadaceae bacterium]|nr:hypothetical protein [Fimbriimonadaceae bacterium]